MLNLRVSLRYGHKHGCYFLHPAGMEDVEAGLQFSDPQTAQAAAKVWLDSILRLDRKETAVLNRLNKGIERKVKSAAEKAAELAAKRDRLNAQIEAGSFSLVG